jgi:5-methylcytosine-specific restriction endonuclease McrA
VSTLHHGDCLAPDHCARIADSLRRGSFFSCLVCGSRFWRKPSAIAKGDAKFCSCSCYFEWQRGRGRSPEFRRKCRERTGERNGNWHGGVTPENKAARNQREYAEWRDAVFARDDWTCQKCDARGTGGAYVRIEAHHIKPFAKFPRLRLDVDNGLTLCKSCHGCEPKGAAVWAVS